MKQRIWFFILIVFISVFVVVFFIDFRNQDNLINRLQCKLFDKNSIEIKGFVGKVSDLEIRLYSGKVIFKNGRKIASIPREYGSIDFLVYIKNMLIGQAGIDNYNWWHSHDFIFDFSSQEAEKFNFIVIGPNSATSYYKHIVKDSLNNIRTEIFYDSKGFTGEINKYHYNKFDELIFDEVWMNDTLEILNIYDKGDLKKHYSTNIFDEETKYSLDKIDKNGLTEFEYRTIMKDHINTERIVIRSE